VESDAGPFIIALYFGLHDPRDVDLFLGDLAVEVEDLATNGYEYNGVIYPCSVGNFILDAPARALVKCCVGHGGMGACEKCNIVGRYLQHRMTYAQPGVDCRPRTDESYARQEDPLHHCGHSPLEFAGIGMVSQFRLDTMHLVYKGVFLRFLEALLTWDGAWNPSADVTQTISDKLCGFAASCPRDFNRKPRKFLEYYKYKATELRRLLLYDGVVAFKELNENVYKLYLLLHAGIYILASSYLLPLFLDESDEFLASFVQYSANVFGEHFVVYNVHSLTHLAEECRHHGPLETFSAFPYENHLKTIKETLRSGYQPLEQIAKRDSERTELNDVSVERQNNEIYLFENHNDPDPEEQGNQFRRICVNKVTFKVDGRDSCFICTEGCVVVLQNIIERRRDSIVFVGRKFLDSDNVYDYPTDSSRLGIMKVSRLSDEHELFPLETVFGKCWLINDGDCFVSIPLAHSIPLLH